MREALITKTEFGQFKCLTEKSQFFPFKHSHLCMPSPLGNIIDSHILGNLLQLGRPSSLSSHNQVSLSLTHFSQLVSIKHWQRLLEIILFVSFFFISNSLGLSWRALLAFFILAKSFQPQDSTHHVIHKNLYNSPRSNIVLPVFPEQCNQSVYGCVYRQLLHSAYRKYGIVVKSTDFRARFWI